MVQDDQQEDIQLRQNSLNIPICSYHFHIRMFSLIWSGSDHKMIFIFHIWVEQKADKAFVWGPSFVNSNSKTCCWNFHMVGWWDGGVISDSEGSVAVIVAGHENQAMSVSPLEQLVLCWITRLVLGSVATHHHQQTVL